MLQQLPSWVVDATWGSGRRSWARGSISPRFGRGFWTWDWTWDSRTQVPMLVLLALVLVLILPLACLIPRTKTFPRRRADDQYSVVGLRNCGGKKPTKKKLGFGKGCLYPRQENARRWTRMVIPSVETKTCRTRVWWGQQRSPDNDDDKSGSCHFRAWASESSRNLSRTKWWMHFCGSSNKRKGSKSRPQRYQRTPESLASPCHQIHEILMILTDHRWESHDPMITSLASSDGIIFKPDIGILSSSSDHITSSDGRMFKLLGFSSRDITSS